MATGTVFIMYTKYACGMFRIASYRIEQAMLHDIPWKIGLKEEIRIRKEIIYAVDIHRKAMKSIFQIVSLGGNIKELLLYFTYINVILIYMFLANYIAQEIMDHNHHLFVTVYNVHWYLAPLHIQRMILFLIQRSNKLFKISIGGIFIGSLESFASLISVSISYFTVMYSTQH
ncbi:PREDICTED: uncharacterized protein LOC106746666 [Dinoponera quadriceps]|uniref:Uncharacterized protein LOC106746666 n=1 Tax=Dinoponera quadriceps TaxID=609295 RepID=A0A6P3XLU4_DINQU|nr:PREDICTED: uncharacterized protein LOC106746666 [Dinoponera quadriceps]